MALSSKSRRRGLMAEINVVPYIDVMLVLVVILMVAAPFVNPSVVNLPSVNKASKAPEKVVDKDVRYEDVVNVMKLLQSAEVERVGLSLKVERPTAAR